MNLMLRRPHRAAMLMLAVLAASFIAPAAQAGNGYGHSRHYKSGACDPVSRSREINVGLFWDRGGDWQSGRGDYRRDDNAGSSWNRGAGWQSGRGDACVSQSHPPHRWYDGRLQCDGRNADGSWRGPHQCEDEYGRKKVNLPGWDPRDEARCP